MDTPIPRTWVDGESITAELLNTEMSGAMDFLTSTNQTTVQLVGPQVVNTGVTSNVVFDTEIEDVDGLIAVPGSTFTFTRRGVMAVRMFSTWQNNTAVGKRQISALVNGASAYGFSDGGGSNFQSGDLTFSLPVAVGDTLSFKCFQDSGSASNFSARCTVRWVGSVDDWTDFDSAPPPPAPGGSGSSGGGTTPIKHVTTFYGTWSRTYDGDGTTTWDDSKMCYQGYYSNARFNTKSLIGFDYNGIKNVLKGASRISVKFNFHVSHTYFNSGSTLEIGGHNYTSKPGTWSAANVYEERQQVHATRGQTLSVALKSEFGTRFQTGQYKGMAFGPGATFHRMYYAIINGATVPPRPNLTFTYWK